MIWFLQDGVVTTRDGDDGVVTSYDNTHPSALARLIVASYRAEHSTLFTCPDVVWALWCKHCHLEMPERTRK